MDGLWLLIPIFFETKGLGAGPVQISTGAWVVLAGVFCNPAVFLFHGFVSIFWGAGSRFFWVEKTPICFFLGRKLKAM